MKADVKLREGGYRNVQIMCTTGGDAEYNIGGGRAVHQVNTEFEKGYITLRHSYKERKLRGKREG